ncbi:phosphoribosyltransferase [Actinoplanes awajinensis]|uniref:phosphoribosyltransferase n=1 Tax=Actinoplanes awajinensis TaxID=135946 RepID=UPI000A037DF0|nr:phosphoribosyltransferase family protein [Actinoplanes awajinensis]
MTERETLTWDGFGRVGRELAQAIVDDVADTGATLKLVRDFCAGHAATVRTAVIYEKPHSGVRCDYVWARTDKWINFPWSSEPAVTAAPV